MQARPYPGTSWAIALPTSSPMQTLGPLQNLFPTMSRTGPSHQSQTSSGITATCNQTQETSSACEKSSINPRIWLHLATHSSIFAWKIPWMEELIRLQSMGLQRVEHDWATSLTNGWTSALVFGTRTLHISEPTLAPRFPRILQPT